MDTRAAHDGSARGEVRTLHEVEQFADFGVWMVDQVVGGIDDLAQVVGRDAGCHANSNALAAVHQKVREPRWHHLWFVARTIEVRGKVDGVFVDARHHAHSEWRHLAFGVSVRGRRIARATEVAVWVDQGVQQAEGLTHTNQRRIDR